jgi:putative transposase
MSKKTNPYAGHRYPTEIISYAVWLYFRFTLSLRDIEELLAYRGVIVTYEAIRQWMLKFGQEFANTLRRRQPRRGDKWHLDEVVLTIKGQRHYLWRAVDQEGYTLDILVQSRRDRKAAKRFFRKLLKGLRYVPRVIITDKLKSYGAAKREILPGVEHRQHKGLNNRAELAPADPAKGAADAEVQVIEASPKVLIGSCPRQQPVPNSPSLRDSRRLSRRSSSGIWSLEGGNVCP